MCIWEGCVRRREEPRGAARLPAQAIRRTGGAPTGTRNAGGRAALGRKAEPGFGCFLRSGDDCRGLVGGLVVEASRAGEAPGPPVPGCSPGPSVRHRGAGRGLLLRSLRGYRHSAPPIRNVLCCPKLPSLLGLLFTFLFSPRPESTSTLGKTVPANLHRPAREGGLRWDVVLGPPGAFGSESTPVGGALQGIQDVNLLPLRRHCFSCIPFIGS